MALFLLFTASSSALLLASQNAGLSDYLPLVFGAWLATLALMLRGFWRAARRRFFTPRRDRLSADVIVDGSNVLYWRDGTPQIEPVKDLLKLLDAAGYRAGVVFDANVGYLLAGRYLHDDAMAALIGLPADRVLVVDKGGQADRAILQMAREMEAMVVSNDRYRDYAEAFPEVIVPERFIRGRWQGGKLDLRRAGGAM